MGNRPSADEAAAVQRYVEDIITKRGSCECFGSGPSATELKPDDAVALMRSIARLLSPFLKHINPDDNVDKLVEQLKDAIPDFTSPTNLQRIDAKDKVGEKVLLAFKEGINSHFKDAIKSTTPNELATELSVYMTNLVNNMGRAYMNIVTRMEDIFKVLDIYLKLIEDIGKLDLNKYEESDRTLIKQTVEKLAIECRLQLRGLQSLVKSLTDSLNDQPLTMTGTLTAEQLIDRIKSQTKSTDTLAHVMLAMNNFRQYSVMLHMIRQYLIRLGITREEYNKASSLEEVRNLVADHILPLTTRYVNDDEMRKLKEAADYLMEHKPVHIADIESAVAKGSHELEYGKAREDAYMLLLSAFVTKINGIYQKLYDKIKYMSKNILQFKFKETHNLVNIIRLLDRIQDIDVNQIITILSGFRSTVEIRQEKDIYVSTIQQIIYIFELIIREKDNNESIITELRDLFKELLMIIETYSERFMGTYSSKKGSAEPSVSIIALISQMNTIKKKLVYYLKLCNLFSSLLSNKDEMTYYGSKYSELLGKVVAEKRDINHVAVEALIKKIELLKSTHTKSEQLQILDVFTEYLNKTRSAISKLWQTAEAIDLYLKEYTLDFHRDPSRAIFTLTEVLHLSEIVGVSLTKNSKTFLWKVMESFPAFDTTDDNVNTNNLLKLDLNTISKTHYYVLVAAICEFATDTELLKHIDAERYATLREKINARAKLPGNPFIALPCTKQIYDELNGNIKALLKNPSIKNIMALFFSIGRKTEESKIVENLFMSKREMYTNIINYIHYSAYVSLDVLKQPDISLNESNSLIVPPKLKTMCDNHSKTHTSITYTSTGLKYTLGGTKSVYDPNHLLRTTSVIMRPIRDFLTDYDDRLFSDTDLILQLIFKSLVSKILSFISYTTTVSETKYESALSYNSILRLTVGAAESYSIPTGDAVSPYDTRVLQLPIDDNFTEVVIRIPLMLELYKQIFNFDESTTFKFVVLTSLTHKYNRLYEIIQYADMFQSETYPDEIMNLLLLELHKIYSESTTKDPMLILRDLMRQYNEMITLVSPEYIKESNAALKARFRFNSVPPQLMEFEYPIQSVDSDPKTSIKLAPSQNFVKQLNPLQDKLVQRLDKKLPKMTITEYINCIRQKRLLALEFINKYAPDMDSKQYKFYTLVDYVKSIQHDIKAVSDQKDKIHILKKVLNEGNVTNIYSNHVIGTFHELVVAPLQHLSAAYTVLATIVNDIDHIYNNLYTVMTDETLLAIYNAARVISGRLIPAANDPHPNQFEYGESLVYKPYEQYMRDIDKRTGYDQLYDNSESGNRLLTEHVLRYTHPDQFPLSRSNLLLLLSTNYTSHKSIVLELARRYFPTSDTILQKLYDILQSINSFTGYSTVSIRDSNITVDMNAFVSDIKETFNHLKKYLQFFQMHVSKEVYNEYIESQGSAATAKQGTYQWLERELLEKLIIDSDQKKTNKLSHLMDRIQYIYTYLSKPWKYTLRVKSFPVDTSGTNTYTYARVAQPIVINQITQSINTFNKLILPIDATPSAVPASIPTISFIVHGILLQSDHADTTRLITNVKTSTATSHMCLGKMVKCDRHTYYSDTANDEIPTRYIGLDIHISSQSSHRSLDDLRQISTDAQSYNNYYAVVSRLLLHIPYSSNKLMFRTFDNISNTTFVSNSMRNLNSLMYLKSTKRMLSVEPDHCLIPTIASQHDPYAVSSYYNNNGEFNPHSHRSIIISFNQLLSILLGNYLYTPFDKISEDIVMIITNELKDEIGNYDINIPDVYTKPHMYEIYINAIQTILDKKESSSQVNDIREQLYKNYSLLEDYYDYVISFDSARRLMEFHAFAKPITVPYHSSSVLCQSLSAILYQISNVKGANDVPMFLSTSQAELSAYYKERMKTFIPIYLPYIKTLLNRCKLFSKFIKPFKLGYAFYMYNRIECPNMVLQKPPSQLEIQTGIVTRITKIQHILTGLVDKLDKYYQMLHDDYVFGELKIKQKTDDKVILPSLITMLYKRYDTNTYTDVADTHAGVLFIPQYGLNDPRHQIQCALRGYFNNTAYNIDTTMLPSMINKFNQSDIIGLSDWKPYMERVMRIAHYTGVNFNRLVPFFTRYNVGLDRLFNVFNNGYVSLTVLDAISVLESYTIPDQYKIFMHRYARFEQFKTRNNFRAFNAIDTNMSIINQHAFMRDTPLCNLIIYSESFDMYIEHIFARVPNIDEYYRRAITGSADDGDNTIIACNPCTGSSEIPGLITITSPTDMMKQLLISPYARISYGDYHYALKELIRGNVHLNNQLLMPKFIDHDIYSTVLFGDLFYPQDDLTESTMHKVFKDIKIPLNENTLSYDTIIIKICEWFYDKIPVWTDHVFYKTLSMHDHNTVFSQFVFDLFKYLLFNTNCPPALTLTCDVIYQDTSSTPPIGKLGQDNLIIDTPVSFPESGFFRLDNGLVQHILQSPKIVPILCESINQYFMSHPTYSVVLYNDFIYDAVIDSIIRIISLVIQLTSITVQHDLMNYMELSSTPLDIISYMVYIAFSTDSTGKILLPFSTKPFDNSVISGILNTIQSMESWNKLRVNIQKTIFYSDKIIPNQTKCRFIPIKRSNIRDDYSEYISFNSFGYNTPPIMIYSTAYLTNMLVTLKQLNHIYTLNITDYIYNDTVISNILTQLNSNKYYIKDINTVINDINMYIMRQKDTLLNIQNISQRIYELRNVIYKLLCFQYEPTTGHNISPQSTDLSKKHGKLITNNTTVSGHHKTLDALNTSLRDIDVELSIDPGNKTNITTRATIINDIKKLTNTILKLQQSSISTANTFVQTSADNAVYLSTSPKSFNINDYNMYNTSNIPIETCKWYSYNFNSIFMITHTRIGTGEMIADDLGIRRDWMVRHVPMPICIIQSTNPYTLTNDSIIPEPVTYNNSAKNLQNTDFLQIPNAILDLRSYNMVRKTYTRFCYGCINIQNPFTVFTMIDFNIINQTHALNTVEHDMYVSVPFSTTAQAQVVISDALASSRYSRNLVHYLEIHPINRQVFNRYSIRTYGNLVKPTKSEYTLYSNILQKRNVGESLNILNSGKQPDGLNAIDLNTLPDVMKNSIKQYYSSTSMADYQHHKIWNQMHYYKDSGSLESLNLISTDDKKILEFIGYMRFNTMLVRNIIWMIQLLRVIRVDIAHHLMLYKEPYVSGIALASMDLTEEDLPQVQ